MSKRDDIILLEDIVDSIKKINGYTTHANLPTGRQVCLCRQTGQGLEYKKSIKSSNANKGTQGSKSSIMPLPNLAFLCGLCDTAFLLAFVSQSSQGAARFAKSVWNAGGLSPKIIFYFQPVIRINYLHLSIFLTDEKIQDTVAINFEIMGEAVVRMRNELKILNEHISWQYLKDFRNMLIHAYEIIDYSLVWDTIKKGLPAIYEQTKDVLNKLK